MKIISKYKDYYDWVVSLRGYDETIVLDRRIGSVVDAISEYRSTSIFSIAFCDWLYSAVVHNGKIYWCEDILTPFPEPVGPYRIRHLEYHTQVPLFFKNGKHPYKIEFVSYKPQPTDLNKNKNCPIIYINGNDTTEFPKLEELNWASKFDSMWVYDQLYNWLSKQKDIIIPDNRTNTEKIVSNGFDTKISFRNIK